VTGFPAISASFGNRVRRVAALLPPLFAFAAGFPASFALASVVLVTSAAAALAPAALGPAQIGHEGADEASQQRRQGAAPGGGAAERADQGIESPRIHWVPLSESLTNALVLAHVARPLAGSSPSHGAPPRIGTR
jgi:hypothetical protein